MSSSPKSLAPRARLFWNTFPWWFLALYRQPLAFLAALLVIPLVAILLWLYTVNERQWRAREGHDLLVAARLASRLIEEALSQTRQIQEAMAAQPAFLEALKHRDQAALMANLHLLLDITPMINRALVTDAAGRRVAEVSAASSSGAGTAPRVERLDGPHPPWQPPVSGVYLSDQASGEKAVRVSSPIHDGQMALGLLQVQYRLQELSRWLETVRVEPAGFLYVVDQEGLLVAYPFQLLPGRPKDISGWPPVRGQASAQGTLLRFRQGQPRRPWTAAVVSLDPYGWRVIAQQPDAEMLKPFRQLIGSLTGLIVLLVGLTSLVILRWAHLHTATLRLVAQQARLLKHREQRRLRALLRGADREQKRPDHVG